MADEGAGEVNVVETEAIEPLPFNSKRVKTEADSSSHVSTYLWFS